MYRRQSYLIRKSKNNRASTALEDLGLDRDDVAYSLNKKGRWLVPQILKHEITNSDDDIKVDIVESHKLKRRNKYTEFCSNDGFPRKVLPQRTYFNARSVNSKTFDPDVTVDIVTPCPRTSSLAHNPKYLDYSPTPIGKCDTSATSQKESDSPKCRKNIHRKKIFLDNTNEEYHEPDYYEDEDEDIDPNEDVYKRQNDVSVGDILIYSSDMQNLLFRELDMSKPDEDGLAAEYNHVPFTDIGTVKEESGHITLNIPNTEVLTGHLKEVFGGDYIECRCLPRKFLIDITDRVTSTVLKSKAFLNRDLRRIDLSTVLIFAYDMIGSMDSMDIDLFKVSINMKTTQRCLRMDSLPENSVVGIEEIVQGAVSYIESLPFDSFIPRNSPKPHTTPVNNYNNILKLCTKEATVFTPENVTIKDILKENSTQRHEPKGNINFELILPDTCSICMESLLECSASALQTCGHWFCDRCWNDHVTTSSNGRLGKVTCPAYKCQCPVDNDILLTISNLQIVEEMIRRQINTDIEKDSNSKWCPNKRCGRVIKYKKAGQSTNVACECGTCFCFDCLQSVHWPLSCRDYDKYLEKLKDNGHIDKAFKTEEVFTFIVQGKRCPVCNVFMEKNGGCFNIYCICGTMFCWGCRKELRFHSSTPCYRGDMYSESGDRYKTKWRRIIATIHGPVDDKTEWYQRAVEIRTTRNPSRVKVMSSAVRSMCRTLRLYKQRRNTDIGTELESFEVSESLKHITVTDKIHPFLMSTIHLYLEIVSVCEYTTVFLEKSQDESLAQLRDRLQRLTEEIHSIFISSNNLDLKSSISRLFHLRLECEKVFEMLVSTVE
ncbi:uncharacterized protein LOC117331396 [Pecten maximus]|uniref:uncharacterized protein LOC117331396 n=1 Tax=Pecten maximus TaxID=6579 RepID=UPI00145912C4|nr:uncharacterized protein LOC117331396 [Pecten maximus]